MSRWLPLAMVLCWSGVAAAQSSHDHEAAGPASQPASEGAVARGPSSRPNDPQQLLRQSLDLYVQGRYQDAVGILRPLVEGQVLRDVQDQKEALRTYGISLHLTGARPGAERAFRALLRLAPGARLDPAFVRPEVVRFFNDVKRRYQLELREVEHRGGRSVAVNLLPPWGQFRNGHTTKAYLLLGGEVGFAATSITTAALLWSWRDESGQFGDREQLYRPLSVVNYVSFGLTAALVVYGIVDGLYYHYRGKASRDTARPGPLRLSAGLALQR